MPRSSFSDNPLLRVSRPVSACSRCRAAKVKCDGKLPACTACEKAGRESECSSANDQFARGKERSYVAALELRIEKLERRLAFARSRKASVNLHEPDEVPSQFDRKDSLAKIRAAIHRKAAKKREDSDINSLISDFGFLSVDATSRDFEPALDNVTFGRFVLVACMNDEIPEVFDRKLPPRHEVQSVVQYYMTNIYTLLPCFSQTKLLTVLDDLYQQDDRVIQNSDYWLAYVVLAIGYVAQSRSRNDEFYRKALNFAGRALPFADGALAPGYVTQIQSLILFTQYSMFDPAHFDSSYLICFACRSVIDLGFHQDPVQSQVSDASALDMRRSIFYCVYSLDRAISMAHARAFSFSDDSINVSYPSSSPGRPNFGRRESLAEAPLTGPQDSDPALFLFELRHKQSNWYQTLFQSQPTPLQDPAAFIWQMCLEMREWSESLPSTLPVAMRELFDLELRYSYVYCLAPSARAPQMTDYTRALVFEHVVAYVDTVHAVVYHGTPASSALYTYHDALKVYFMATQLINILNDGPESLLAGAVPAAPFARPGAAPPPPLPRRRPGDGEGDDSNVSRTLRCLRQVAETLQKYGERWDNALPLRESFNAMSRELWAWLEAKRGMGMMGQSPVPQRVQGQGQNQGHLPTQQQPRPQPQQHQPQQQHHQQYGQVGPSPPPPSAGPHVQGGMGRGGPRGQHYQWG